MSVPFDPVSITSITQVAGVATVTVASTSALVNGYLVLIEGANEDVYNGQKSITVASPTTFTYAIASTAAASATGTMTYRTCSYPYEPFLDRPVQPNVVSYHSQALENNVVILTEGRTVTSLYGYYGGSVDAWLYVFDSTTVPADGDLTALNPQLKFQTIKIYTGFNFYIDVPTDGTRFYKGLVLCVATNGNPATFVKLVETACHYDLQYHS